jgi:hypothetical protein
MIHIATVHWNTDKWISIQQRYLQRHIKSPYRVYAWLNGVPPVPPETFYYTCTEPVDSHAVKLNILADVIYFSSNRNDDIVIFLDGDAFPIGDIEPLIDQMLRGHKLIAVQRLENNGDDQPHPCFCATTVGFWQSIKGDWKRGYRWRNQKGEWVADVGGRLLKQLRENGVEWYPLLRSNKRNMHPVFFGIYGRVIYHHGAGFRGAVSRADSWYSKTGLRERLLSLASRRYRRARRRELLDGLMAENHLLSEKIFEKIQKDPFFYTEFI